MAAGAGRVLAMTLHSPQVHGFFSVPGRPPARAARAGRPFPPATTCPTPSSSPPTWATPRRPPLSPGCSASTSPTGAKQRFSDDRVVISSVIGEVDGQGRHRPGRRDRQGQDGHRAARPAARTRRPLGRVACTHGLFADGAIERLGAQPDVEEIVCTNTVPDPSPGQTDGPVDRPGAGRSDAADPRRRVGQRAVQRALTKGDRVGHPRDRGPTTRKTVRRGHRSRRSRRCSSAAGR